jgi:HPt (histidine-containing phosphotransfer) domain-containing protein
MLVGDADELRKSTHSLKGASANLGLELLADLCRELEEVVMVGKPGGHDTTVSPRSARNSSAGSSC